MGVKIRERKPGEWWVFIDHNNQRRAKKVGSKSAAEKAQKQIEAALTLGDLGLLKKTEVKPDPTFAEYQKDWLKRITCKQSTRAFYEDYQDRYVIPRFGTPRLKEITASRVQLMMAELREKGLSANTIRLAVASLRSVLSAAVKEKLLSENPAEGLGTIPGKPKREARSMEPEE